MSGEARLSILEVGRRTTGVEARRHGLGRADGFVVGNGSLLIHTGEETSLFGQLAKAIGTEAWELKVPEEWRQRRKQPPKKRKGRRTRSKENGNT